MTTERIAIAAVLALAAALSGCGKAVTPTPPARGEARIALFKQCMDLAAKMQRQSDDDVGDVVSRCSDESYYMTMYIK